MRKIIVNQKTLEKARNDVFLAYREAYLRLQKLLIKALDWDITQEEKKKIARQIKELGKTFKETKENFKNSKVEK